MPVRRSPLWTAYLALSIGILTLEFSAIFTRLAAAPGTVVSFYRMAINYAQGYLPASLVAPTLLTQPVLAAILAGLMLGERFTPSNGLGEPSL